MNGWFKAAASCAALAGAAAAGADPAAPETPWEREGREALERARALRSVPGPARNVVILLGDGMGIPTVTAARILEGQRRGLPGEEHLLSFERLPHVALTKTYNTDQQVPDSAGTMTAICTGAKTRAGHVAVDEHLARSDFARAEAHRLKTILEEAEERGLATGIVTTTTVTHATPAACYAHSPDRRWEDDSKLPNAARAAGFPDIALQLVEFANGDGLDVVLGGGRSHFRPKTSRDPEHPTVSGQRGDGRDLVEEWRRRHPSGLYVWSKQGFDAVDPDETERLLGLFEPVMMQFEADRPDDPAGEPSLSEMTAKALDILSRNPKGFVLVVEGGRIDHAHHQNNAYRALTDTLEFAKAVRVVLERTSADDTLVLVTADHGHGLHIGGYSRRGNPILGKVRTTAKHGREGDLARDALDLPYTVLSYHNGPGYLKEHPDLTGVDTTDPDYRQESVIPLRSETHSGEDVPVYARGPGAHLIHGVQEQSYLYYVMVDALGWRGAEPTP